MYVRTGSVLGLRGNVTQKCIGSVLTVCCSVLRCIVVCCSVSQCVAVLCTVLHCVAGCCRVLQCVVRLRGRTTQPYNRGVRVHGRMRCSALQRVAVSCSMYPCIALFWIVLQWGTYEGYMSLNTPYLQIYIRMAKNRQIRLQTLLILILLRVTLARWYHVKKIIGLFCKIAL